MKKFSISIIVLVIFFLSGWANADLNTGLVAYYPFHSNANDESGNGNHGVVRGAILCNDRAGNFNSAYSFDGIDDIIIVNDPSNKLTPLSFTVSAWFNWYGEGQFILYKSPFPTDYNLAISGSSSVTQCDPNTIHSRSDTAIGLYYLMNSTHAVELNRWYHVAFTLDNSTKIANLYLNGNLIDSTIFTGAISKAEGPLGIGGYTVNNLYNFRGIIDEVRIYSRALSESEIQELYSIPAPLPKANAGPDQIVTNEVTLDGSQSFDSEGEIISYLWELIHRENPAYNKTASGQTPAITGLEQGFYDVSLTVTNDQNLTDTDAMILAASGPCQSASTDNSPPVGSIHAHDNMLWPPNNQMTTVTLEGYVKDELSMARDEYGIGVSSAYILINESDVLVLRDEETNLINAEGRFQVDFQLRASKGAVFFIELYASDTNPPELGGPNSGLVDSTYVRVPHDRGNR